MRFATALVALVAVAAGQDPSTPARPNILWITCEDISPNLGCYGDAYAVTPNLDALATQGSRYTRAFAPIGVCAPSRSSLILGTYACSAGTHPMRCSGARPAELRCFPEYLREAGYHCTNNEKTDYNFPPPKAAWAESSKTAHWKSRKPGQPFFSVFNITLCHESQIRLPEAAYRKRVEPFAPGEIHDPAKAELPPYHPDLPEVRRDWARYADMITAMDKEAGRILKELDDDGLAKDTIVFFFSDHGAGMPRSKRWLYDSSLRVPFLLRVPERWKPWSPSQPRGTVDRLVTFVDFGPTVLNLAGVPLPAHLQGRPFLGPNQPPEREYVHGFRDRMDERIDMVRAVRDRRWKYLRNFRPELPWSQHVSYMYLMPTMQAWQRLHEEGKLDEVRGRFFGAKPAEELYDTEADPWEIRNLAADPAHAPTLARLRAELRRWILEVRDLGFLPEGDLRTRFGSTPPYAGARTAAYPLERILDAAEGVSSTPEADPDGAVRYWAALRSRDRIALEKLLTDPAPDVQVAAAGSLARLGRAVDVAPTLIRLLVHENEWVRVHAANALDATGLRSGAVRDAFQAASKDANDYVRRVAATALLR